ncbi:YCF48-related protein [Scytonema sp. PCC 10023]|uniref:WD40/YVTN/BNR-like repeat-containing protein n=1 Tax=Scytonema sp. PCC 10023 TaxID=1680591 RepID=UPI0039C6583A
MTIDLKNYRWVKTNSPIASSRTDDIWFFNPQEGWLVNSNGQVSVTRDGGSSWTTKYQLPPNLPGRPYLRCIQFASPQVGWFGAVTNASKENPGDYLKYLLHQTTDGGDTWTPVDNLPEGSPGGICGLSVVNEMVVYGSGANDPNQPGPSIIKTTDGGKSWNVIDMSRYASNLVDIHFFDENRGWVVGGRKQDSCPPDRKGYERDPQYAQLKPVVLYTQDGGKTWGNTVANITSDFDCGGWGWKIYWLNEEVGFVSIENFLNGAILRTTDGGQTWEMFPINDCRTGAEGNHVANANLEGIGFISKDCGWVGGWGDAQFIGTYNSWTWNGGQNWVAQDSVNGDPLSDVRVNLNRFRFFFEPLVGYSSGKMVYKYTDQPLPAPPKELLASVAVLGLNSVPAAEPLKVEIRLNVPQGTKKLYIGFWNYLAWYKGTLVDEDNPQPGTRTFIWDGKDDGGNSLAGGTYICRAMCDDIYESININLAVA